jgi:hypothetical protein
VCGLVLSTSGGLSAQPTRATGTLAWLDAGGARVQQPQSTLRSAGTVGAGVWHGRGAISVAGEGSVTLADDSLAAAQWVLRTTFAPERWHRSRTDLDVSATTNGLVLPGANGNRSAAVRQALQLGSVSVFGGAGLGRTSRLQLDSRGHAFSVGADWLHGAWRVAVTGQRAFTDDWQLMEASGIELRRVVPAYIIDDVTLDLSWRRSRWWLGGSRSWRAGSGATTGTATGHSLVAAWQLSPSLLLIAQGGEQMADAVRGVPQARYTGVAMRWNPVRVNGLRRDARAFGEARALPPAVVPDVRTDEVLLQRRPGEGTVVLTIDAPADAVVEVAYSATDWAPVRMAREGGAFVHRLTLPAGTHRVAVRVNGGAWRAPRGLAAVADDFGGKAGVVVVP